MFACVCVCKYICMYMYVDVYVCVCVYIIFTIELVAFSGYRKICLSSLDDITGASFLLIFSSLQNELGKTSIWK